MTGPHLVYFADPMCSWCWGFSPVVEAIRRRFGSALPIRLVLGGLRPGTTRPMDAAAKTDIRAHWDHVRAATGQPFDFGFFDRPEFIYDTDPAARAVVVARRAGMETALDRLRRIQHAFYAENRDVTDEAVLANLAEEAGEDRDAFIAAFRAEEAKTATWRDYGISHRAGIDGFPALVASDGTGNAYAPVARGYQPPDRILAVLEHWLD